MSDEETMNCVVYKSERREAFYLFVPAADGLEHVPQALRDHLAPLSVVMDLELTPQRRLARQDAAVVLRALRDEGFYLQTPPARAQ